MQRESATRSWLQPTHQLSAAVHPPENRQRDTLWTDGSRSEGGEVGAVCIWVSPGGCTGRRFYLRTNKEVFDAESCKRVLARNNEVTIRWVSANSKVAGSEKVDEFAKAAASRSAPQNDDDDVPDGLPMKTSLSHMSRSATEAKSRTTAEWISSHVRP